MRKIIIFLAAIATLSSCRPDEALGLADSFRLSLNTDIFNYRYSIVVSDDFGAAMQSGVNITLNGEDASKIFTEFGDQSFALNANGELTFTVNPNMEPTEQNSLNFSVNIKKAGYESATIPIRISIGQFNLSEEVTLVSYQSLKDKLGVDVIQATASGGALNGASVLGKNASSGLVNIVNKVNMDTAYYDGNPVSVLIEDGAQFYYMKKIGFQVPVVPRRVSTILDSAFVNGVSVIVKRDSTWFDDTVWVTRYNYERELYKGDKIEIFTRFRDVSIPETANSSGRNFNVTNCETKYDGSGIVSALVMRPATVSNFVVYFNGELADGTQVGLSPDAKSILYSMLVDPAAINPSSSTVWSAGDSLEIGWTFVGQGRDNAKSVRLPILLAGNGELRIQSGIRPKYAGAYEVMDFSKEYEINLTAAGTVPDTSIVPDRENLRYGFEVYAVTSDGEEHSVYNYGGKIDSESDGMRREAKYLRSASSASYQDFETVSGTFYSVLPISTFKVYTVGAYFDKQLRYWNEYDFPGGIGTAPLFRSEFSDDNNYLTRTRYDVKVICAATTDSTILYPSASATSDIAGNRAYASLVNGRWDTRGISLLDTLSISISYKDWSLDTAFVVTKPRTAVEYIDQTGLDVCNL
jgi:hypothetical protein